MVLGASNDNLRLNSQKYAVVDNFSLKDIDLDGDNVPDISHGELVETFLKMNNPNASITRFPIEMSKDDSGSLDRESFSQALNSLAQSVQSGEKFDGVNMSVGLEKSLSDISDFVEIPLTPDNVNYFKKNIKKDYSKSNSYFANNINNIEKVTASGVPFYVSAGNNSKDSLNLYGLANGVTMVGGTDPFGEKIPNYPQNSSITKYQQARFHSMPRYDQNGDFGGMDLNFDGKPDIPASVLSTRGNGAQWVPFSGTSFATPFQLAEDTRHNDSRTSLISDEFPVSSPLNSQQQVSFEKNIFVNPSPDAFWV